MISANVLRRRRRDWNLCTSHMSTAQLKEGWRKEGRMCIWLWIYAHMCICIRSFILDWLLLPFQRIICIFAFEICRHLFVSFSSSFLWLCPKNLIVNKNLPCGKFVMQTNEMRHKSRSEREGDREREAERDCYQLLFIISQLKLWESFVALNNACDARDFTLTRRYLIELMGKMPSPSPGVNMQRRGRRGGAGQGGKTCNLAIYIAGFEFTLASN